MERPVTPPARATTTSTSLSSAGTRGSSRGGKAKRGAVRPVAVPSSGLRSFLEAKRASANGKLGENKGSNGNDDLVEVATSRVRFVNKPPVTPGTAYVKIITADGNHYHVPERVLRASSEICDIMLASRTSFRESDTKTIEFPSVRPAIIELCIKYCFQLFLESWAMFQPLDTPTTHESPKSPSSGGLDDDDDVKEVKSPSSINGNGNNTVSSPRSAGPSIADIKAKAIHVPIQFAVSRADCYELLMAAHMMGIQPLVQLCARMLAHNMNDIDEATLIGFHATPALVQEVLPYLTPLQLFRLEAIWHDAQLDPYPTGDIWHGHLTKLEQRTASTFIPSSSPISLSSTRVTITTNGGLLSSSHPSLLASNDTIASDIAPSAVPLARAHAAATVMMPSVATSTADKKCEESKLDGHDDEVKGENVTDQRLRYISMLIQIEADSLAAGSESIATFRHHAREYGSSVHVIALRSTIPSDISFGEYLSYFPSLQKLVVFQQQLTANPYIAPPPAPTVTTARKPGSNGSPKKKAATKTKTNAKKITAGGSGIGSRPSSASGVRNGTTAPAKRPTTPSSPSSPPSTANGGRGASTKPAAIPIRYMRGGVRPRTPVTRPSSAQASSSSSTSPPPPSAATPEVEPADTNTTTTDGKDSTSDNASDNKNSNSTNDDAVSPPPPAEPSRVEERDLGFRTVRRVVRSPPPPARAPLRLRASYEMETPSTAIAATSSPATAVAVANNNTPPMSPQRTRLTLRASREVPTPPSAFAPSSPSNDTSASPPPDVYNDDSVPFFSSNATISSPSSSSSSSQRRSTRGGRRGVAVSGARGTTTATAAASATTAATATATRPSAASSMIAADRQRARLALSAERPARRLNLDNNAPPPDNSNSNEPTNESAAAAAGASLMAAAALAKKKESKANIDQQKSVPPIVIATPLPVTPTLKLRQLLDWAHGPSLRDLHLCECQLDNHDIGAVTTWLNDAHTRAPSLQVLDVSGNRLTMAGFAPLLRAAAGAGVVTLNASYNRIFHTNIPHSVISQGPVGDVTCRLRTLLLTSNNLGGRTSQGAWAHDRRSNQWRRAADSITSSSLRRAPPEFVWAPDQLSKSDSELMGGAIWTILPPSLTSLDVAANHLTSMVPIMSLIDQLPSLLHLDLSSNQFGDISYQLLRRISTGAPLQWLSLANNSIRAESYMREIGRVIAAGTLRVLDLSHGYTIEDDVIAMANIMASSTAAASPTADKPTTSLLSVVFADFAAAISRLPRPLAIRVQDRLTATPIPWIGAIADAPPPPSSSPSSSR